MSDDFRRETFDIIQRLTGDKNVVVIPRLFVTLLEGDYTAAAILNQIVYWTDHTKDPDGWFYKSYEEWTTETGLSKYQVSRACKGDKRTKGDKPTLHTVGVETIVRKTPKGAPTVHYRINREVFIDALRSVVKVKVDIVDYPKVNNVDEPKSTNSTMDSQQTQLSSFTETTSETTHIEEKAAATAAESPAEVFSHRQNEKLPDRQSSSALPPVSVVPSSPRPNAYALFEQNLHQLTPLVRDTLDMWLRDVPAEWVEDAIREAALNNAKSVKYISKILIRWQKEGRNAPAQSSNGTRPTPAAAPAPTAPHGVGLPPEVFARKAAKEREAS